MKDNLGQVYMIIFLKNLVYVAEGRSTLGKGKTVIGYINKWTEIEISENYLSV